MPRKNLVFFLVVLFALALGISRAFPEDKEQDQKLDTLKNIINHVLNNYVTELTEEEKQQLYEGAYRGALMTLDPYSQYLNETQNRTFAGDTEGKFGGLGIEISINNGVLTVIAPIRGTPAYEAGILAGDVILKIDGESTEGIAIEDAVSILRGEPGADVILTVRHPGSAVHNEITVTRAVIVPPSVEYDILDEENGIGYMRIAQFNGRVTDDLRQSARELLDRGLKGLILDLRQNPGGLLDKSVEMCDEFLAAGGIVSVKGRHLESVESIEAKKGGLLEAIPLVVLIDGGSASASEIVAGALRDHKRALLVGEPTFGKGSVQKIFALGDGQTLKLTTARYYTPSDKPIKDREGITPDVVVPMSREHLIALRNQEREDKLRGHYSLRNLIREELDAEPDAAVGEDESASTDETEEPEESQDTPDEEKAKDRRLRVIDYQLQAAVNVLKWQLASHSSR